MLTHEQVQDPGVAPLIIESDTIDAVPYRVTIDPEICAQFARADGMADEDIEALDIYLLNDPSSPVMGEYGFFWLSINLGANFEQVAENCAVASVDEATAAYELELRRTLMHELRHASVAARELAANRERRSRIEEGGIVQKLGGAVMDAIQWRLSWMQSKLMPTEQAASRLGRRIHWWHYRYLDSNERSARAYEQTAEEERYGDILRLS